MGYSIELKNRITGETTKERHQNESKIYIIRISNCK